MAGSLGSVLVGIATAAVAVVLMIGLYSLLRGGDFARSYSNKLMRLRVVLQFAAIVVIMAVLYISGR
ncbi:MAG TPA: twin transmembrane helix small protein [Alphaproteobacteria bacterium]|nr:twin transmembrane helix small protein [Alphaproteobacteria bacterium]HAJ45112.1 twin transmembrane helix small protein [Alphaproteobacteria bacterium]